ncbi:PREDICTED: vomeronasal type-1 receptor 1-like [Dipodomys ordii]|uniref:Vomeronasal type-1 receptor n=1 Tax=Dipodomys ordii TaxID=10020 RepID=A0A1S3G2S9_DIPOR|nr:PREDICTED: vomeronasal type-1 receptor 1-like [Dipodomys ordii]
MGIAFLTQTAAGILGNSCLLCFYTYTQFTGQKVRPIDPILIHLVFATNFVVLSRGIAQTMAGFGCKYFLDDAACKVILYFYRVARGVSLISTCLLSGFLILVNVYVPLTVIVPKYKQIVTVYMRYRYCSLGPSVPFAMLLRVFLCVALIIPPCNTPIMCFFKYRGREMAIQLHTYWINVLFKHKQSVQHIHSHITSGRLDHEARAMNTILALVSRFISFYCLSAIFTICVGLNMKPDLWLLDMSVFLDACFSLLSPFVLISTDTRLTQVFYSCTE